MKRVALLANYWMYYLPQYSSELDPVELVFGAINRKIINKNILKGWKKCTRIGKDLVVQMWAEIEAQSIVKAWKAVIRHAREHVLDSLIQSQMQLK